MSLNLAIALSRAGVQAGVLDADLYAPDLAAMVGLTRRRHARSVEVWSASTVPEPAVERFGIRVMSAQFLLGEDQALALTMPLANLLLARLREGIDWGDTELLVVDLPPGTADLQQLVARHLDLAGVLMVVTPQDVAHLDAKKALTMFRSEKVPILGGIENMAGLTCPCCDSLLEVLPPAAPERTTWAAGVERLASFPLQPAVAAGGEAGVPITIGDPDGEVSARFDELARLVSRRLAGE